MQIHKIDATSIGQEARLFTRSDTFWSHSFVNAKKLSSPFYLRALGWPVLAERILTSSSLVFGRFQLGLIFQGEIFQVSSWNMEKSENCLAWSPRLIFYENINRIYIWTHQDWFLQRKQRVKTYLGNRQLNRASTFDQTQTNSAGSKNLVSYNSNRNYGSWPSRWPHWRGFNYTEKSRRERWNPEENLLNWTILASQVAVFDWLHHDMTSVLNVIKGGSVVEEPNIDFRSMKLRTLM